MTFIIVVAAGILLGLFFRFYVLIPGALGLTLIFLITALSRGDRLADILVATLLPQVCLQVGYVFGLCLRELVGMTPDAKPADAGEAGKRRRSRRAEQQPAVALAPTKLSFWNR